MESIFRTFKRAAESFRRFRRAEDGSYITIVGLAAIPMVAAAGLGVDIARGYLAEARLQSAIDAAAIAMGSADGTDEEIITLGRSFFYANFPDRFWAQPTELTIDVTRLIEGDPDSRPESFTISAKARVETLFFGILQRAGDDASAEGHYDYLDIGAASKALTEVQGLEVVMVLDVTGSMWSNFSGSERRIEAMRDAALKMVDILFDENPEPELLRVGIVPYNTAVNIGTNMHSYVTGTGLNAAGVLDPMVPNPFGQTSWYGCVQTRKNDNDLTDAYSATATDGTGKWHAYQWPIEPDRTSSGSEYDSWCLTRADHDTGDYWRYEDPLTYFEQTSSDSWYDSSLPPVGPNLVNGTRYYDRNTDGPNKGCPGALLPLTNVRADVWDYLQNVTVVDGVGTVTATGLTWGWRVVSPGEPFDQGEEYENADWEKVIIVLTDGEQRILQQSSSCDNARSITDLSDPSGYRRWSFDPDDYGMDGLLLGDGAGLSQQREGPDYRWTAYGYVHPDDSRPLGPGDGETLLEVRLGAVCDAIKDVEDR